MPDIPNPHDRFFKQVFSNPDVAEDFVRHVLPEQIAELLKPGSFRLAKGSFVDRDLAEFFSDLLYEVDSESAEDGFGYVLVEHKSTPAADIFLQLFRYMTRIWERAPGYGAKSVPLVLPLVLYHGTEKWNIPVNFASLYRVSAALADYRCDFKYFLCNLSSLPDESLRMGPVARLALLLMKHIHSDRLKERLTGFLMILRDISEQAAFDYLRTILTYLNAATRKVTIHDCRKAVAAALHEKGEEFMDRFTEELVAEHWQEWLQQGLEQGRQEGRQEGIASLTLHQLMRKFGRIAAGNQDRVKELSIEELERLGVELLDFSDESALEAWLDALHRTQ